MRKIVVEHIKRVGILYKPLYWLYIHYLDIKKRFNTYTHRERRCSYGNEHPDKTFYIIGMTYTTAGLFAIVKSIFCHIVYANHKGYVPVVDMKNYKSQISDAYDSEKNAWEMYFQQPGGFCLDDIARSKNVIKSCSLPFPESIEIGLDTPMTPDFHAEFSSQYKKYIVPTPDVAAYAQQKLESVIGVRKRILGVLCRGTDYTESKPSGHPIQPTAEQAITKAMEVMQQYCYEYVFLATEDKRIYETFLNAFGDKLLFSGQKLYEGMNGKRFLSEFTTTDYKEKWHNTVDYYSTIFILSKCDGLVAGLTCGSICAYLMSNSYRYIHFWNLGKYE